MNVFAIGLLFGIGFALFLITLGIALAREMGANLKHCLKRSGSKKSGPGEEPLARSPRWKGSNREDVLVFEPIR